MTRLGPETTNGPENIRNVSSVLKFASGVVAIQHDTPPHTHPGLCLHRVLYYYQRNKKRSFILLSCVYGGGGCQGRICHFLSMEVGGDNF